MKVIKHTNLVRLVLFLLFVLSVGIRWPQTTSEVKSHEQTYILTLQTSDIWRNEGVVRCHFTPMWTYGHAGDKHMAYYKRLEDADGHNYYVSFPPLSFLLAHAVLLPFDLVWGKLILQIFNYLLHFLSALMLYGMVRMLVGFDRNKLCLPALVSYILYLFMPVVLYFHTDIFFPEMIGQVLWIACMYLLILMRARQVQLTYIYVITLFLFVYAEWLAVFFVSALVLWHMFAGRRSERGLLPFVSVFVLVGGGSLMFLQYASIAGFNELFRAMGLRFLERSGFFGETYSSMGVHMFSWHGLGVFGLNLHKAMFPIGYVVLVLFVLFVRRISLKQDIRFVLVLSLVPLLLHWIIFFNANALHLLLMARVAVPLSIMAGLIMTVKPEQFKRPLLSRSLIGVVLVLVILVSGVWYQIAFTIAEPYPALKPFASYIKQQAQANERVFIVTPDKMSEPEKYLTFMTGRNIVRVKNLCEADAFVSQLSSDVGVSVFELTLEGDFIKVK